MSTAHNPEHQAPLLQLYTNKLLQNEKLQSSLKLINQISEPFVSKYSALINGQIDKTLKKIILHKDDFKLLQKVSEAREKFIFLGDKVLTDAENRVENYYNSIENKEEEEKSDSSTALIESSLRPRLHNLLTKVNSIAKFWAKSLWFQLKSQKIDRETFNALFENLMVRVNLWENLTKAKIAMELGVEYFSNEILHPSVQNVKMVFVENRKNLVVCIEGIREKGFKEVLKDIGGKAAAFKDSYAEFYKNKVLLYLSKENLKSSKQVILHLISEVQNRENLKKHAIEMHEKGKDNALQLYQRTVEKLKEKKDGVKDSYFLLVKKINERRQEHDDKSTDHNSDSEKQSE